jgi:integrase
MLRWIRATTRSILQLALERDLIAVDPSSFMVGKNAPKVLKRRNTVPMAWNREEARQFMHAVQGDRLEALWLLLLTSGLRRGESLALQWDDLDFNTGTLGVSKALVQIDGVPTMSEPKTLKSYRTIAVGVETLDGLKTHRRRQSEERLGSTEWAEGDYIFTRKDGSLLRPDQVYVSFKRLVSEAGLPWIRLHGLRHTMASLALQSGVDVATVSERLGHADVGITTRTYLHGSAESDRQAAMALDRSWPMLQ